MGRRWTLPRETWASPILPSRHQTVPWILPSYLVSRMFFTPIATALAFPLSGNSLLKVSPPRSRLQPVQSAHRGRVIFFNLTNLSVLKALQCLLVTFRTKSQLSPASRADPSLLASLTPSSPFPLRSNYAKLLVTFSRPPAPSTALTRCLLSNRNVIVFTIAANS